MNKVSFLFWNLNRRPLAELVAILAREHQVDVLVLAECKIATTTLLRALNAGEENKFSGTFNPSALLRIFIRLPSGSLTVIADAKGIAIRRLALPIGADLLLVAAHFPSKLYQDEADQMYFCRRVAEEIEAAEAKVGHTRTILMGDLNMSPFEKGVVAADGLHAVMDARIAAKGTRTVQGKVRRFFYNPMWNHLGDAGAEPPGSFYHSSAAQTEYFWHLFDQVLLRPALLPRFAHDDLKIITKIGETSLLTAVGRPNKRVGSDHLPVLVSLDLEERTT